LIPLSSFMADTVIDLAKFLIRKEQSSFGE